MKMEKEVDRGGRELRNTTHCRCHRKLEAGRTDPLLEPRREQGPGHTLLWDFCPPELRDKACPALLNHLVCSDLLQQAQETKSSRVINRWEKKRPRLWSRAYGPRKHSRMLPTIPACHPRTRKGGYVKKPMCSRWAEAQGSACGMGWAWWPAQL